MKRLALLVLAVIGLIAVAIASAPLIAATEMSKRRIADQIEEWTGHPVSFVGKPTVKLFPFLSLTIEDARIGEDTGDGKPFVVMDRLTCKLRLLQFLLGVEAPVNAQVVRQILMTIVLNTLLALPVYAICRRVLLPFLPDDARRRRRRAYTTGGLSPLSRA